MSLIRGGEAQRWRGLMRIFVMICVSLIVGCVSNSPPRQQAKVPRQVTAEGLSGKGLGCEPGKNVNNKNLLRETSKVLPKNLVYGSSEITIHAGSGGDGIIDQFLQSEENLPGALGVPSGNDFYLGGEYQGWGSAEL